MFGATFYRDENFPMINVFREPRRGPNEGALIIKASLATDEVVLPGPGADGYLLRDVLT